MTQKTIKIQNSKQLKQLENSVFDQLPSLKKFYRQAYENVIQELEQLNGKLALQGKSLTRSELYRINKLESIKHDLAEIIDEQITKALVKACKKTANAISFDSMDESEVDAIVNMQFKGERYSARIWNNTDKIAQRVYEDMVRIVSTGESPDKLKKALIKDFSVGYHEADRLMRTECSRVFNAAATNRYEAAGVEYIKIAHTDGCNCKLCTNTGSKVYLLGQQPQLPLHPNCKCCYMPVIK